MALYLFLEETGWVGSFHLMTCDLIHVYYTHIRQHKQIKYSYLVYVRNVI